MADKTIGDLTQAESIGSEDLFVLEQSNEAKKLKGAQLVKYAQDAVGAQVTSATQAAENAAAAKTGAESAQTEAQAARDAILNMIVEAITLESGAAATVDKSLVDSVYKLTFGLPSGKKGDPGATGPVNKLTIGTVTSGTEASATITGEAPNQVLNLVLKQGEKGDSGVYVGAGDMPEGYNVQIDPSGSGDEIVTAESIESALGYTPADSNEVGQIKEDLSAKLDKPSTAPAVGKILKVTAVNEDGTFTCEWADDNGGAVDDVQVNGTSVVADGVAKIPLAKLGSTGVVKFDEFMPFIFNADALRLANADEKELTNPRYGYSTNRAITASNYRLAVKLAMCDGKGEPWTDEEKTSAYHKLTVVKNALDDGIAVARAQYYLGERKTVSIVLPDDEEPGDMITVSWYNGDTAATLSITGTMLSFDYTPSANTRSEINALWDGRYWAVLGNEMAVPSEVAK